LVTLRFCFGIWWRRATLALNGMMGFGSEHGAASYPNRTHATNLRSVQQRLTACKMARHLGLTASSRVPGDVEVFLARNMEAYMLRRGAGRPI
jgi:hypothetical protein